ncbi:MULTISPECIES: hypothetical protein [unclassified Rhizobacter]|uniref:hypothetical protein n=1 Tax=unclassified Rhizobacter TaxID=2640088 RepID=UPI0006FB021C|nr:MULTISPECIES: hypothetical protein [unclassified Rhizobacter]KQU67929.1 hypothetical protein ASC88_08195 [Rhizobacter sp. Root29]KQW15184.1 hypothetical protein ASC98_13720 [Rhizobacter sp. Root1238]KRB24348.1 hypothetical protein ASE08_17705 [Rhizobacter sp. Root16D2]
MPASITSRSFTDAEKLELQRILRALPGRLGKAKLAISTALLMWAASLAGAVVVWLIVAAVAKAALGLSFGWNSPYRAVVVFSAAVACAAVCIFLDYRWLRGLKNPAPSILADLEAGTVVEENYEFSEVKRLQEPEHGGLTYFLKSSTGRAYVLIDHERQQIGVGGDDPLKSSFHPRAQLRVVRAPDSRVILSSEFAGSSLSLPEPTDLLAPPSAWPDEDEYCPVPWDELEARFGEASR